MMRRLPLAFALMALAIYIIVPTPDELVLPFLGYVFAQIFNIGIQTAVVWSFVAYLCLGFILLASSILIGGGVILKDLKKKLNDRRSPRSKWVF
jgi:membrane protein DedA with SNARE-associated domain